MKRFLVVVVLAISAFTAALGASPAQPATSQEGDRFYITGFVRSPGAYQLVPRMTVRQAIATAGGLTERGSDRGIKIIKVNDRETEVDATMSTIVEPNDTIRVRQRLQ
jgi:protein involved in polysaccharide export with SLBB domain